LKNGYKEKPMSKNEFEMYLNYKYAGIDIDSMPIELVNYFPKSAAGHHKFSDMGTRIRRRDKTLFKALFDEHKLHTNLNDKVTFKLEAIWNPLKKK
jgi:hypothetical protein